MNIEGRFKQETITIKQLACSVCKSQLTLPVQMRELNAHISVANQDSSQDEGSGITQAVPNLIMDKTDTSMNKNKMPDKLDNQYRYDSRGSMVSQNGKIQDITRSFPESTTHADLQIIQHMVTAEDTTKMQTHMAFKR